MPNAAFYALPLAALAVIVAAILLARRKPSAPPPPQIATGWRATRLTETRRAHLLETCDFMLQTINSVTNETKGLDKDGNKLAPPNLPTGDAPALYGQAVWAVGVLKEMLEEHVTVVPDIIAGGKRLSLRQTFRRKIPFGPALD